MLRRRTENCISLDLDFYARALQLCEGHRELRGKYILRLGELHVVFAHLRAIGHFIGNSGIDDIWIETEVFGPNHIKSILACTHMKRAVTVHEATLLAMYKMYFHELLNDYPDLAERHGNSLRKSIIDLNTTCKLQEQENLEIHHSILKSVVLELDLPSKMKSFEKERSGNSMFQAIRTYMNMVERLLLFIQASGASWVGTHRGGTIQ